MAKILGTICGLVAIAVLAQRFIGEAAQPPKVSSNLGVTELAAWFPEAKPKPGQNTTIRNVDAAQEALTRLQKVASSASEVAPRLDFTAERWSRDCRDISPAELLEIWKLMGRLQKAAELHAAAHAETLELAESFRKGSREARSPIIAHANASELDRLEPVLASFLRHLATLQVNIASIDRLILRLQDLQETGAIRGCETPVRQALTTR